MGISNKNTDFDFEGMEAPFKSTAYELSMIETEARLEKMISSPLIESLERHEAMMNSIISSPTLEAIEKQQRILGNFPSIEKAIAIETQLSQLDILQSQSLVQSAAYSSAVATEMQLSRLDFLPPHAVIESASMAMQDTAMYRMAEVVARTLEKCNLQHYELAESLAKAVNTAIPQLAMIGNVVRGVAEIIPKLDSAIVVAMKQAAITVNGVAASLSTGLSAMENIFSGFDFSNFHQMSDRLSHMGEFEEKNEILKNFGWYMIPELPEEVVDKIFERREEITQEEVDALIVQHFRNNRCQELKNIVKSWKHLPYFEAREFVFHDAQVSHSRRSFNASTTLISIHFEGIVTDFVRDRLNSPTRRAVTALKRINDLADNMSMRAMPFEDWIICSYVLEWIDKAFTTHFTPADPDNCPNTSRHKIAHGHAIDKETEANSLRRFLFMNELYKLFLCLENEYQLAS